MNIPVHASLWVAVLCAGMVTVLSIWMWRQSSGVRGLPGCGSGSACEAVTRGRWSRVGPIPVSLVGAVFYASLFAAVAMLSFELRSAVLLPVVATAANVAILAAAWFFFLQLVVVRRLCLYCTAVHACAVLAAMCLLSFAPIRGVATSPRMIELSVTAVGILILAQMLIQPRLYAVLPANSLAGTRGGAITGKPQADRSDRSIQLLNDRVTVDLEAWPVLGSPDANHVIVWLFDFVCKECHRLHPMLLEAISHYQGRLAVVAIPVPPYPMGKADEKPVTGHEPAFAYARLGLALWAANPPAYGQWDRFMAQSPEIRRIDPAAKEARKFAKIRSNDIIRGSEESEAKLAAAVEVAKQAGDPMLPTLVLPKVLVSGRVPDVATLIKILDEHVMQVAKSQVIAPAVA